MVIGDEKCAGASDKGLEVINHASEQIQAICGEPVTPAGCVETSMMLVIRPELVDMSKAGKVPDGPLRGDASRAMTRALPKVPERDLQAHDLHFGKISEGGLDDENFTNRSRAG